MAKNLFNRYIWLVDIIYRTGRITLEEINERWVQNALSNGEPIPRRTFLNHRNAIEAIFDILIECDRKDGYNYYIENIGTIEQDGVRSWLLNTFAVNNLINESHKLKNRIQLEQIPSGKEYLTAIIEAMRDNVMLEITYQSYQQEAPTTASIDPYFVKVFKQRWYVIAYSHGIDKVKIYALDRIQQLSATQNKFEYPKEFNPEEFFHNSYGIFKYDDIDPCIVKIKINFDQVKYLRALPLHHSQKELERNDAFTLFEYYIRPSFDFRKELLSMGAEVEVLEPKWFREEIKEIIKNRNLIYY